MVEPVTRLAPRPLRGTILAQGWRDLTLLHWPVDPALVAPLLPRGTVPDTLDGVTYVGLVPFRMVGVSLGPWPPLPYLGTFAETNVRLYSVDNAGRRGVVFRSLEAARLAPVLAARWLFRLPYMWARMRITRAGDTVAYETRRRWPGPVGAGGRVRVRIGARIAEPSAVEEFLTARWGLHVDWHGRTLYLPNAHEEWPLHRAELLELDDRLVAAAGLPGPVGPPVSVLWSPGVRARFGRPLPGSKAGRT